MRPSPSTVTTRHCTPSEAERSARSTTLRRRFVERRAVGASRFAGVEAGRGAFNLTHDHLREADREFRAEKEHLAAARSLLSFEHRACEGLSKGERSSCPLFASRVSLIELTQTGLRIVFQTQVDVDQTWRR